MENICWYSVPVIESFHVPALFFLKRITEDFSFCFIARKYKVISCNLFIVTENKNGERMLKNYVDYNVIKLQ